MVDTARRGPPGPPGGPLWIISADLLIAAQQRADQLVDLRDRTEVRRRHVAVGDFDVELGFDGEHEVDRVERRQAAFAENVIVTDRPINRSPGHELAHELRHAFRRVSVGTVEQGEYSPNVARRSGFILQCCRMKPHQA